MSDATDNAQRDAEVRAGKEITKAKENSEKIPPHGLGGTSEMQKNAEKLAKQLKKKLNRLKGRLSNRDYEAADDLIDDFRNELKVLPKENQVRKDLEKNMKDLEKIKDEELWLSPTIAASQTAYLNPDLVDSAVEQVSDTPIANLGLDPSYEKVFADYGINKLGDLIKNLTGSQSSSESNVMSKFGRIAKYRSMKSYPSDMPTE